MRKVNITLVTAIAAFIALPLGVAPANATNEESNQGLTFAEAELYEESVSHSFSEEEVEDALEYWTPERLAAAEPMEAEITTAGATEHPEPFSRSASGKLGFDDNGDPISREPGPNVGRLSFPDPVTGRDNFCTATVVDSETESLLITAAHCVHGGGNGKGWYQNLVFNPGYSAELIPGSLQFLEFGANPEFSATTPGGTFPVIDARVLLGWANPVPHPLSTTSDNTYDVAFVTVGTNHLGQTVQNTVGGGSDVNFSVSGGGHYVNSFGYPGKDPEYFGIDPVPDHLKNALFSIGVETCRETIGRKNLQWFPFFTMNGCDSGYTQGISGGPWLVYESDSTTDYGTVISVSSFRDEGTTPTTWAGPIMNAAMKRMMLDSEIDFDFVRGQG